ncbi:zinc finger protein SNAI3 [Astyanax mexicanus]|uniref:Zinc finger protein SNAI2 n=1 Tax=Astyanax mexicanus TaxID=7994 RepID=A0A8B9GPJ2_ASTMX|nr:zinc finger protein SNAI3 [Astyanax mexicanus]
MPRSFLVKKHLSHKKPNYSMLDSEKRDPQTQTIHRPSSCSKPNLLHLNERLQPGSIPVNSSMSSTVQLNSLHPVIHPQPPQDPDLPGDGPAPGHTYPLPASHNPFRNPQPGLTLLEAAALPQPLEHNHSVRHVEDGGVPSVTVSLLGLTSTGSSQERFECFDCHKAYFTFSGLAKHRQLQCEWQCQKYFSCKYCDKEYVSLGALKMHIRTHTLPCVCKLCGKAFSRPWLLQGHIRTHTGEKPFSCPHCSRAFADRSNLRAHLQTHSDIKKYQCRSCSKTFSRISLLSKHEEAGCCPMS